MVFNFTPNTCNLYASIPSFYWYCTDFQGYEYGAKIDSKDVESKATNMLKGYSTVRASASFRDMFENTDCRKLFPGYVYEEDGYFISKFGHRTNIGDAEYPFCRIGEAYLIKAEAELQTGNTAEAKKFLILCRKCAEPLRPMRLWTISGKKEERNYMAKDSL